MSRQHERALILGDSLGAKRGDEIAWEDRWPQKFERFLGGKIRVVNCCRRAATSRSLRKRVKGDYGLVVIQLGVVDSVPRYFTQLENAVLSKLPRRLRERVISYLKSRRRQEARRAYVSVEEYRANYEFFLNNYTGNVVLVKILEPGSKFKIANIGAVACIREYNQVLDEIGRDHGRVTVFDVPGSLVDELTLDDGYHLSHEGHAYMAKSLAEVILKLSDCESLRSGGRSES